jgi:hypothetical protein
MKRQDDTGLDVKVTAFPDAGKWGIRILRNGKVVRQTSVDSKRLIGPCIADELRMFNKCGDPSPMADAARDRLNSKNRPSFLYLLKNKSCG